LDFDFDFSVGYVQGSGPINIINIKPGNYEFESHKKDEKILCLSGCIILERKTTTDLIAKEFRSGEMATVPAGVIHKWGQKSDGVVLVVF